MPKEEMVDYTRFMSNGMDISVSPGDETGSGGAMVGGETIDEDEDSQEDE